MSVPLVALAPEYRISRLIKGGWQLAGGHGPIDRARAIADMSAFAEAGITTFDCADIYTGVEELIGGFLRQWRGPAVQVHTKYVPDLDTLGRLSRADVARVIDRSLSRLGIERIDLVQFHWWDYEAPGLVETAGHLADLEVAGKIRHLGATNFDAAHLTELLRAGVPLVSHQIQCSLLDRRSESLAQTGVPLLCYGSLAGGFLSERWLRAPEPREPLENRSLTKYKLIIDEFGGWAPFQELLAALARIAARHGAPLGAVALRWTLDRPQVAGVIVGARDAAHLRETLEAVPLRLDDEDRAALERIAAGAQGPRGDVYGLERVKGGRHARIMKYNLNAQR
jgi:aryl-alcohol dehydrogenase-like predicted oxidoreductase